MFEELQFKNLYDKKHGCPFKQDRCSLYQSGNVDEHACNRHYEDCTVYKELVGLLPDEPVLRDD